MRNVLISGAMPADHSSHIFHHVVRYVIEPPRVDLAI